MFDQIQIVLQQQRIDERSQRQIDRLDGLVQRGLALELPRFSPLTHDGEDKALDLRFVHLGAVPALRSGKRRDVVELAIVEEQIHTCGDHGFHQPAQALGG
ncbi:hypothetical protein D3C81_1881210 [compost metagenome]